MMYDDVSLSIKIMFQVRKTNGVFYLLDGSHN